MVGVSPPAHQGPKALPREDSDRPQPSSATVTTTFPTFWPDITYR